MTKEEAMKPVLLNKDRIREIASEIISKLGAKRLVAIWIYKSRVAGTANGTSDVDIWIQLPDEYSERREELQSELDKLRLLGLDYTKWKYPVLMFQSKENLLALNFGNNWWGLPLDLHVGCGVPPKPKKYEGYSPEVYMMKLVEDHE